MQGSTVCKKTFRYGFSTVLIGFHLYQCPLLQQVATACCVPPPTTSPSIVPTELLGGRIEDGEQPRCSDTGKELVVPDRVIIGMVITPVDTVVATAEPETEPIKPEPTTAT